MEVIFQYRRGNSLVHRMDPVTKTVVLLAISFLAFGSFVGIVQFAIMITTLFVAFALAKLSFSDVWRATKWLIIACILFFYRLSFLLELHTQGT